jgi:predicted phage-related endonuclease
MIEHRPITSRAEWLDSRLSYLTASDLAGWAGTDPYRKPARIFAEKLGTVPSLPETGAMRRGRNFEPAALEYLKEDFPTLRFWRPNVFIVDEVNCVAGTPDYYAEDSGDPGKLINVQVKVVEEVVFERWDGTPPIGYRLQTHTENYLADAARGMLAVLVMKRFDANLVTFDVPRRDDLEEAIRSIGRQFRADLKAGRRPAFDYAHDGDVIRALLEPKPVDPPLDLSTDNRAIMLVERYETLTADIKASKDELETVKNELIAKLDGAERAIAGPYRLTWREEHRKGYTVAESSSRKLRVSQAKEKAA